MNKEDLINHYQIVFSQVKDFRKLLKGEKKFVHKKALRTNAEEFCKLWFNNSKQHLLALGISKEILSNLDDDFREILKLSSSHNLKSSYEKIINRVISDFQDTIIIPLKTSTNKIGLSIEKESLLASISDKDENEYLTEAIECFNSNFKKAAIVLGWCAAIYKIHNKIEKIGFTKFNETSETLSLDTKGRFKRFNKKYSINSLSELQEVFDNDILWIIEGLGLIDSNQHTRLKSCFDMRNHSAHPGAAPITDYNVLSFFSDIIEIILTNKEFE